MSKEVERTGGRRAPERERGVEALRQSSAFRGPAEPLEDHEHEHDHDHSNDHLALLYEGRDEQFAAVIPFLRQGLEHGERCLYVADETPQDAIVEALREAGVDADAALESGALTILSADETYLSGGTFDLDESLALLEDIVETDTEEFDGLRITSEETWLLRAEDALAEFTTLEARVNELFRGERCLALCQYDRERLPADVLEDVVKTHPYLVSDATISRNFYYTPPETYFRDEDARAKVDHMVRTLRERTEAKADLREHKRYVRELYEITADSDRSFEEKVEGLLELGCDRFDLDMGFFLERDGDEFRVRKTRGTDLTEGTARLSARSGQYCKQTITLDGPLGVEDTCAAGWDDDQLYREYDLGCYLGTKVTDGDGVYGTICFADTSSRKREFADAEYSLLDLLGQWLSHELERRRREADLRRSKEQFERIFEGSHDAIYINDPNADEILAVNEAGCEMLGFSREEILARGPSDFHPDEMDRFEAFVDEVYENGSGWTDELTCLHSDNTRIPAEISASTIEYEGRRCLLAIVRDISERKERERELERAKRQFEAVFNNPVSFVGLLDPDGTIRRVNENALEFIGVDESTVRGEKFWETPWFDHSEDVQAQLRDAIARAADGEYVQAEIHHRAPDGETAIMDSILEPVLDDDGDVVAIVPSGHDITELTERERFQRRLYEIVADPDRSFDEQLRSLLELGCEWFDMEFGGLARVDPDADLFEVEVTNGDHESLEPGERYPLSETYCQAPVDREGSCTITDPIDAGYDGKLCYDRFGVESYLGTHLEIEGGPDRTFWFVSTEPHDEFSDADRAFHHLMGQWVKYELDRQQYERDLEETVEQLQQSNDRLKQFAYAASHDLQEPLRMVSSYLQLLENRYADDLDAEAREFIEFAVDGADRMRSMVDDLLAFSRVEHADGEFESVDCNAVLERVTDDLQVRIEENDATVVVDSLPTVQADREQLEQLFSNLVSNGIKYNESETPRIEVGVADRGDRWEFTVADNGIGIEPEKTERIFEVFKRLHHDDEYPGTGIGLSLCQEIAENHGGDVRLESEPGEGSTFYVTLPKRGSE